MSKLKFDRICSFFLKGNCNKGDQCQYSHDAQAEKVDLERNEQGKLVPKRGSFERGRGRGRGRDRDRDRDQSDNEQNQFSQRNRNDQSERWQRNQDQDEPKQSSHHHHSSHFRDSDQKRDTNTRVQDDWRNILDRPQYSKHYEQKRQNNESAERNDDNGGRNTVNSARWQRNAPDQEGRGRGRGRGYGSDQEGRGRGRGGSDYEGRGRGRGRGRETDRPTYNVRNEELIPAIKKVKRNEYIAQKRDQVLKLEQLYNIDNFINLLGFYNDFLGIITLTSIEFYLIPFKRSWSEIIDEERKVCISHKDKTFLNGWIQETAPNIFTLIVQFQRDDDQIKHLLIFDNVFQSQIPIEVCDIGVKNIAYAYLEDGILYTFCSDGLIRLFRQDANFKYFHHFDLEQGIESVVKVGSNYLIGSRNNKLLLFDGKAITEIPFKIDQKCTQMLLDFNRVILKFDDESETNIYVLTQQLEVVGPLYKGDKVNTIEIIKSYENEKLYLLGCEKSLEIFKEHSSKLHSINIVNQAFEAIRKIEITNENMVTQKYILCVQGSQIKLYSLIPEQ